MRTKKDTIVFDLMGVLFQEGLYVTKILYPLLHQHIEYTELKKRYTLFAIGNISPEEFWRGLFVDQGQTKDFEKTFLNSLRLTRSCTKVLKRLCINHRLILFSEIPRQWGGYLLQRAGIRRYFDCILLSGQYGSTKPYNKYFNLLESKLQNNIKNVYLIEDSLENLMEAKKRGFITVWFDVSPTKKAWYVDHKISRLEEILTKCNEPICRQR